MNGSAGRERAGEKGQESPAGSISSPSVGKRLLNLVKSMPAFMTGLAAVVTASATIIGIVVSRGAGHQPGPGPSASPATTSTATATTTPTAAPTRAAPTIYWGPGALLINTNMDFDTAPPTVDDSAGEVYLSTVNAGAAPGLSPEFGTKLALWTGADTPGARQCLNQAETQSSEGAALRAGADICVLTPQHRVVLVQVTGISDSGVESRTTVWTMPAST